MPATDEYWRSLPRMHQWFAGSAFVLLAATLLMMFKDEDRAWRGTQSQNEEFKVDKLDRQLQKVNTPEMQQQIADAKARFDEAEAQWNKRDAAVKAKQKELAYWDGQVQILSRTSKNNNAERDKARADYDIKVRDESPDQLLIDARLNYERREEAAIAKAAELETAKDKFAALKKDIDAVRAELDESSAALAKSKADIKSIEDQIHLLAPGEDLVLTSNDSLAAWKRWAKELPIINGFNPHLKIQYDWARDLKQTLGMATVSRVDRCRTCHVNISDFGAGNVANFPLDKYHQPFASHPNPELYLTETSPHPVSKFACTICHEGDGSGTAFKTAEHTASNPATGEKWHEEFGWHKNHFWEYPMFPKQFTEAGCLRCHHNVVELGTNAKFGNSAPKVVKGYELIRDYGCFGCHDINGYDGTRPIGPDMRLEPQTFEEFAKYAADPNQIAGTMMKVGPSLRHISYKTTPEFMAYWVADPQRFRPTTRMPKPFGLANQQDAMAHLLQPVEQAAVATFLASRTQDLELLKPAEGYTADAARGLELFKTKGCLNCHSKQGEQFAGIDANFGPDLSRIHEKVKAGADGFNWLYTWIKEPTRYHARTKMPDLFLDPVTDKGVTTDPAADITAYLLQGGPTAFPALPAPKPYLGFSAQVDEHAHGEVHVATPVVSDGVKLTEVIQGSPAERAERKVGDKWVAFPILEDDIVLSIGGQAVKSAAQLAELDGAGAIGDTVNVSILRGNQKIETRLVRSSGLDDLVRSFLAKSYSSARLKTMFESRRLPVTADQYANGKTPADSIKGDEVELAPKSFDEVVSEEEWTRRKQLYIGRRTVSRYGCYGCHDIPGFETARPIGTALQDWGRKDTSKLAYEHIHEFLHHHGDPNGGSTQDRLERAVRDEFGSPGKSGINETTLVEAYLYQDAISHGRAGFLWQKLREPRSYDYMKTETKGWDERLRMPKFPFNEEEIQAVATFVLGLVADPPAPAFQYRPTGAAGAIVQGERILAKYNCTGCHMVEMPVWEFAVNKDNLSVPELAGADKQMYERFKYIKPPKHGWTGKQHKGQPVLRASGYPQQFPDPQEEPEFQMYSLVAWDPIDLGDGKLLMPGQPLPIQVANLVKKGVGRGGAFAQWLIPQLPNKTPGVKDINEAWQAAPPPLVGEGFKVQTAWLYQFLKNPEQLRYTTVLRMPKFNLSDEEAQTLANYFAAVDHAPFPYQKIPERQADFQRQEQDKYRTQFPNAKHPDYLEASWLTLNGPLCRKCHVVGGNVITDFDPAQVKRGPNLQRVEKRLQSDYARLWVYNPKWIIPYTSMPQNFPPGGQSAMPELFDGQNTRQAEAVVDALFNYTPLIEQHGKTTYDPPGAAPANAPAQGNPGAANGGTN